MTKVPRLAGYNRGPFKVEAGDVGHKKHRWTLHDTKGSGWVDGVRGRVRVCM